MRYLFSFFILLYTSVSFSQFHFWHNSVSNKCSMARFSCQEHLRAGCKQSGVFKIIKNGSSFNAYCDQVTEGGGWMLVKRMTPTSTVSPGWSQKIQSTTDSGTLGSSLNFASDYNLSNSKYPSYTRHMVYRYINSPSFSTSSVWSFDLNTPLSGFALDSWANLPNLKINNTPSSGTFINRTALHVYYGYCGANSGSGSGAGETIFCKTGDSQGNSSWGSSTFNAADYGSINRMISGLSANWNSSLGFIVLIK